MSSKPKRSTPYMAPGAPKSPLWIAITGWATAISTFAAYLQGMAVDPTVSVSAAIVGTIGLVQNHMARCEQRAGVAKMDAAKSESEEPTES